MRQVILLLTSLVLCAALLNSGVAQGELPPQMESDEAKFVRLTEQLERDPFGDTDRSIRTWLLNWVLGSEDVTVVLCGIFGPIPEQKPPYWAELFAQGLFGNAAFQIAHPGQRNDLLATQVAGVRSSLRAYNAVVDVYPDAHIAYFDTLQGKEHEGELEGFLSPVVARKCAL